MKSSFKLLALFLLLSEITFSQISKTDTVRIYFQQNQSRLNAEGKKLLENLKENSENYESAIINGRASEEGEPEYNQELSAKRNNSICSYLEDLKFDVPVSQNVLGENQPIHPNKEQDKLEANRMVEIILYKKLTDQELMNDFFADNAPSAKEYEFDSDKGLKILNNDNVYIYVPPYALQFPNGQTPTGKIKVKLKQVKSFADMILTGMHTESEAGPLQTAGMYEVQASKGNQVLQLKAGSEVTLQIQADSVYADMQAFSMNHTTSNWVPAYEGVNLKPFNIRFNYGLFFKKNLTKDENAEVQRNIKLLKEQRRNMLDVLIGGLIRNKEEEKINRLIQLFSIQAIGLSTLTSSLNTSNGVALFESKTQRSLKLNDDQFANIDFSQTAFVKTTIGEVSTSLTILPDSIDLNNATLSYYNVKMSRLSMFNCDRFMNLPNSIPLTVGLDSIENSKVYLIMPYLNGAIPGWPWSNKITFRNVPLNQSSVLFAFGVKNGKWYYSKKAFQVNNKEEKLEWTETDRKQIEYELKNI